MKITVVIAASFAAALTLCSAAAAQTPPAAPETATGQAVATQAAEMAALPIEESVVPLRGTVVGVPVPGLTQEFYIGLGSAHQVAAGEYFLAYNPNVRAIAILKTIRIQDRMSAVESLAQLASLRNGDSVKRISAKSAMSLVKQIEWLAAVAPPLSSSILIDPDLLAASQAIEAGGTPVVPAPMPIPAGLPDLAGITLLAKAAESGVALSWQAPAGGSGSIARYVIYRSTDPKQAGTKLAERSATDITYEDASTLEKGTYIYRLAAVDSGGQESASFPSIEVAYAPGKKKMLMGQKNPQVKAKVLPPFINIAAAAPAVITAVPTTAAAPVPSAPTAAAAAPAPATPTAAAAVPVPAIPTTAAAAPAPVPPAAPPPTPPEAPAALPPASPALPTTPPPLPPAASVPPPAAAPQELPAATPGAAPPLPAAEAKAVPAATPTAALPAPARFSASVEGTTVEMSWNPIAVKEQLAGYIIYRGPPGDEAGAPLNSKPTAKTNFRDRSAAMGESYYYWVVAQTVEGRQSEPSRKVKVDMPKSKGVVPFF